MTYTDVYQHVCQRCRNASSMGKIMDHLRNLALFLLGSVFFCFSAGGTDTDFSQIKWDKIREDEGIQVYRTVMPGGLFAFRAEGDVHASMPIVASALVDISRRMEWMPSLGDNRILKILSPTERIEYTHIKTPFIIKDRDFILLNKASYFPEKQEVLFDFRSTEEASFPHSRRVRGQIHTSFYRLKMLPENNTHVEFIVYVDPKGNLPNWIVNLFAEKNPFHTLRNLRNHCAKPDILPNQDVLDALQGKGILVPQPVAAVPAPGP